MDSNSPPPNLLNLGLLGPNPAFGSGSQPESEQSFGNNGNSPSIESMLGIGQYSTRGGNAAGGYPSGQGTSGGAQGYRDPFSSNSLPTLQTQLSNGGQQGGPMSAPLDGQSPVLGQHQHQHRSSMGSNGHFASHYRHGSLTRSDTASPHAGQHPFGEGSNERVTSQPHGDGAGNEHSADSLSNPTPSWSELKTKAGKDRKRLPLACIACRRKKIRCSGEKPACKHCLRSRIPCVYKVTTRKAAPRTDYMAMLDKRLKRMEDRVIKVLPKDEQGVVANTGRAVVKPPLPPPLEKTKSSGSASKKRIADQAFGNDLDEWAASRDSGGTVTKANGSSGESVTIPPTTDSDERSLLLEGKEQLPPKELQEHLSEVFFDYVYGQSYHLLHKPSFMRKLAQGTVPPVLMLAVCAISARFSSHPHPSLKTEPAFLRGEQWATAAREIALKRYDTPNITILIVYLILGLHEFGTCQGGRSWMFGGMAQRMAYALQLHKDLDHEPRSEKAQSRNQQDAKPAELTFTDREIRRRTMWSCFLMDRFNSSGTERPIFVSEQYIKAQLPLKEQYFQMEITGPTEDLDGKVPNPVDPATGQTSDPKENMGVAAYLIRLVSIWGKLIHYMNLGGKERDKLQMWEEQSIFQSIRREIDSWDKTVPSSLRYSPENLENHASDKIANQFIFLHLVRNQIKLFMNRFTLPFASGQPLSCLKTMPPSFLSDSRTAALEAADQISALVHEAMDYQVVAPFAGYCAFFSSTVHVHGAFSKNKELETKSKRNLAWNVKYLTKMKKYWGMFHFMTENLRDVYRRQADAARLGTDVADMPATMTSPSGKESEAGDDKIPIFQYGDWFDRYPHGVSGTDYEEPSAEVKKEPGSDAVLGQKSDLQTVEEFFSKMTPPSGRTLSTSNAPPPAQQRKAAKKRHPSKPEVKQQQRHNSSPSVEDAQTFARQQQQQQQLQAMMQARQMQDSGLTSSPGYQRNLNFAQHSAAFPPGFNPPPNPLLMTSEQQQQSQGFLSQVDRQMVMSSYAGIDPNSTHASQSLKNNLASSSQSVGQQQGDANFDFDMSGFPAAAQNNPNGDTGNYWGDPSTAWFMPFNLDPPSIAEDGNLFSGNIDWQSAFGGFGDADLGDLPPTGLTPRLDSGQDGMEGMQ